MRTAIILGGAKNVFDDLSVVEALGVNIGETPIIATNHAGRDWPAPFLAWVSFHAELFPSWLEARRADGMPDPETLWTTDRPLGPIPVDIPIQKAENWRGSSGLLAVTVGLHMGFDRLILCGVPMDADQEHYDRPGRWVDAGNYRASWLNRRLDMAGKVRSPSGWTKTILGAPSVEWLSSGAAQG